MQALVDLLPFLELNVALGLMLAIWPLCSEHRAVKEQLIMCLRKAMFRPDVGARLLAVRGFIFLVLQELQAPDATRCNNHGASSSQVNTGTTNSVDREHAARHYCLLETDRSSYLVASLTGVPQSVRLAVCCWIWRKPPSRIDWFLEAIPDTSGSCP